MLHIVGAILMYLMYQSTDLGLLSIYCLHDYLHAYAGIGKYCCLSGRLTDPEKQFSGFAVWGTIGWIIAGFHQSPGFQWEAEELQRGALKSHFSWRQLLRYSWCVQPFLPKTPPVQDVKKSSVSDIIGLNALRLLKERTFLFSLFLPFSFAFHWRFTTRKPVLP